LNGQTPLNKPVPLKNHIKSPGGIKFQVQRVNTGEMTPLRVNLQRRRKVQTFAWPRIPQWRRDMPKLLREALVRTRDIRPVHVSQQDQAGRPFHQGAEQYQ